MDLEWALLIPAYLVGTFPTAIIVGRRMGHDVTREGSGNPGASNTYRTLGRRAGAVVLLGDLAKGVLAAGGGLILADRPVAIGCGLAAVLGHVAPLTRRLRGGKGVATAAGVAVVLLPLASLALAALWVAIAKATGTAAAGSVAVAAGLPVSAVVVGRPAGEVVAFAACAALVVARHRENLVRLQRGDERPLLPGAKD